MRQRASSIFKVFLVATISALCVRLFILENYRISSNSMLPRLTAGDVVFISKLAFNIRLPFSTYEVVKFKRPDPGEIVAFSVPDRGIETFVKRVVATENDRVEIKDGVLYVNGQATRFEEQPEGKAKETLANGVSYPIVWDKTKITQFGPIDVPKEHFFVLGDNRVESADSRVWGPVPYSCLKGRLAFTLFSN